MSQPPPPYERSFSFTDHSVNTPDLQQPGQKIDQELNNVLSTVNQTVSRLGEIQADDGKLRESAINGSTILQTAKNDAISAVNAAGTTNVAAVNAAGTTNVSAVTTAGQVAITAKNQAVASAAAAAVSAADANTQREMAQAARNDTFDSAAEVAAAEDNMIALAAGFTASANAALATANDAIQDAQDAITQAQEQVTLAAGHANDASESAGTAAMSSSNAQYYAGVSQASAGEASTYKNQAQSFSSLASSSSITAVNASNASASHAGQAAASALAAADSAVSASNSAISAAASAAIATATTYAEPIRKIGSEVSIDPDYKPGSIPPPTDPNYSFLAVWNPYNSSWSDVSNLGSAQLFIDQGAGFQGDFGPFKGFEYSPGGGPGVPAMRFTMDAWNTWAEYRADGVRFPDSTLQTTGFATDWSKSYQFMDVAAGSPSAYTYINGSGVQFPDLSLQTTAGIPLPAVAGLDGQVLSTDGVNPVWIDNSARTLFSAVRNETGATLTKGTVVYINGASGNKATVAKAQADADATSATTFAVLSADIANNNNGTAIVVGELAGLNTSAYAEGAALYLSPTVAGGFTTTKPSAPNHIVYVATVTRSHANQGIIEVRIQNGYELDELHDVQAQAPNNGDSIFYDSSDQQWKTGAAVTPAIVDAQRVDIQTFGSPTTSGSFTWTKPAGAKFVEVYIFGAGGGGGSGARYATTSTRGGGGGGSGGSASVWKISASDLGSTVPVTVGAGGAGAPGAIADNSVSAAASSGGDSIFGNYRAGGGTLGAIGSNTTGGGGGGTKSSVIYYVSAVSGAGGSGTANNIIPTAAPANSFPLLARGGSGSPGAAANNTTQTNGVAGGTHASTSTGGTGYTVVVAGGTGGTNASPNGGAGTASPILLGTGAGGGSGAYRPSAVGGAGGNGGWPSGGGGAGSASDNGFASGAGGSGANGRVVVITYF